MQDLEKSVKFYTEVLGFRVSDVYPATMVPDAWCSRCAQDHHGVALVGGAEERLATANELNHMAFEVSSIDEVFRARDLEKHGVRFHLGRRRAGCQVAVEFFDPDNHVLEIYWGIDQIGTNEKARPAEEWREELTLEAVDNAPWPGYHHDGSPSLRKD